MYFVRTASERDIAKVQELLKETWHATYDKIYGAEKVNEISAEWHSEASLKARLAAPNGEFLVADSGTQIGGMAFASLPKDTKKAMLHQLYVRPGLQGQGIGRDLFAEIETCFPAATHMRLEVEPENTGAIAFYKRHGFVEVDKTDHCGGDSDIPALVFEKELIQP